MISSSSKIWDTTVLTSVSEVFDILLYLRNNHWIARGQSTLHNNLVPKIDRPNYCGSKDRNEIISIERQSIELFRATARFFASPDEQEAMRNDVPTLMVLQHYGVPTRLLDWSQSPYIATYFSVSENDDDDGELWAFRYDRYIERGNIQWENYPGMDPTASIEERYSVAFSKDTPRTDFFMCVFYYQHFHRIDAQEGLFSMTAEFGKDHAISIADLLVDKKYFHRYVIKAKIKKELRRILHDDFDIWLGSLFPDTSGAAHAISKLIFGKL
jgi:hypothetical protein